MLKDKKTKLTFHNGILTIGGTIIEVVYEDSHIFFDFGSEYNPASEVQPETLQDLLDHKLVPYIDNIFDKNIPLEGYDNKTQTFNNTAVFLSHVHLDHSKIVNYLDEDIPLYTLEGTKNLTRVLNIDNNFLFPRYGEHENNTREITGLADNEIINIGKIQVKVMPVDHDAYGACGLVITTPDLVISYTGDIRLHGYKPNTTLEFCKESENCDVLLIEGVSVSFSDEEEKEDRDFGTEPQLVEDITQLVNDNPDKQITFNYYVSNVERILNIIETSPRTVVLDAYYAYVVYETAHKKVHYYRTNDKDYGLDPEFEIDINTLFHDTSKYFWQFSENIVPLVSKLQQGGIYIHSNAQPLGEFDPKYAPFMERFSQHGIEVHVLSNSGHAYPKDLMKIINLIQPKLLVPIHSRKPERLFNEAGERLLPTKGQTI